MFKHSFIAVMLGFTLCGSCAAPANAQQGNRSDTFVDARNKIGILRYCRDQGLIGQITAEFAIEVIEAGPGQIASGDASVAKQGERVEKLGEAGIWGADGDQDVASIAKTFSTTPVEVCKELAATAMKLKPAPVVNQAETVTPTRPPAPAPVARETPPVRNFAETRPTSAIQRIAPPPPPRPPVEARRVSAPAPAPSTAEPMAWYDKALEVNKWKFNRRERPWGWE